MKKRNCKMKQQMQMKKKIILNLYKIIQAFFIT